MKQPRFNALRSTNLPPFFYSQPPKVHMLFSKLPFPLLLISLPLFMALTEVSAVVKKGGGGFDDAPSSSSPSSSQISSHYEEGQLGDDEDDDDDDDYEFTIPSSIHNWGGMPKQTQMNKLASFIGGNHVTQRKFKKCFETVYGSVNTERLTSVFASVTPSGRVPNSILITLSIF